MLSKARLFATWSASLKPWLNLFLTLALKSGEVGKRWNIPQQVDFFYVDEYVRIEMQS